MFYSAHSLKCHGPQAQQWLPKWLQWQQKLAFWFTTCRHRARHSKAAGGGVEWGGGQKGAEHAWLKKKERKKKNWQERVKAKAWDRNGKNGTEAEKTKSRLNCHAQIERESVSFKSSGQTNKVFIRRLPELDRQMLLMAKLPSKLLVPSKHRQSGTHVRWHTVAHTHTTKIGFITVFIWGNVMLMSRNAQHIWERILQLHSTINWKRPTECNNPCCCGDLTQPGVYFF